MMHKKFTFFLLLLGLFFEVKAGLFFDEFGMKENCQRYASHAWCILSAGEMAKNLEDIPRAKVESKIAASGNPTAATVSLGLASGTAAGLVAPAPGIGRALGSGMYLASALLNMGDSLALSRNQILAWMPMELAANEDEAAALFQTMIIDATKKTFSGFDLSDAPADEKFPESLLQLVGGDCVTGDCILAASLTAPKTMSNWSKPKSGRSPGWLGGYKAWVFDVRHGGPTVGRLTAWGKEITQQYVPAFSKNLPKWVFISTHPEYIYQTSNLKIQRNNGQKIILVFNEGKAYAPIFPEIEISDVTEFDGKKR